MPRMSRAPHVLIALSFAIAGCEPELGECNIAQANRLVFYFVEGDPASGTPAYEGQALMQQNCSAGGSCHSEGANGSSRRGAPAGLNYDVQVACELASDGMCPEGLQPRYDDLLSNSRRVFDHGRAIMAEVEAGAMPPPGMEAQEVLASGGEWFRASGEAVFDSINGGDTPLPSLDTPEGEAILRNWLACGAPVVGATRLPDARDPGQDCGAMADVGDCFVRYEPPEPPEPTWESIYDFFSGSNCVSGCHDGSSTSAQETFMQSNLDLSDQDTAYMEMVGVAAEGEDCGGAGAPTLIVPNDAAASLLIHKLEGVTGDGSEVCGGDMPQGRALLPEEFIAPIRQWIDEGANEM